MVYSIRSSPSQILKASLSLQLKHSFHQQCASCHLPTQGGRFICDYCALRLNFNQHHCQQCGEPLTSQLQLIDHPICGQCLKHPPFFNQSFCPIIYNNDEKAIIDPIKKGHIGAIKYSATLFQPYFYQFNQYDIFLAIPMSEKKLKVRHDNPSEQLCKELLKRVNRTYGSHIQQLPLQQIKDYPAQKGLNLKQRKSNVRGAFIALDQHHHLLKNKSVVIVDDVMTSGSTLNEAARVMVGLGAKQISVAAIARTPKTYY